MRIGLVIAFGVLFNERIAPMYLIFAQSCHRAKERVALVYTRDAVQIYMSLLFIELLMRLEGWRKAR